MLKIKWLEKSFKYDGSQLKSLFAYLDHGVLGDSCVAWRGACDITFEHMVDGEDLLTSSAIRGQDMVHFVFEIFETSLTSGVLLQRLFTNIVREVLLELSAKPLEILREGDDLYIQQKKLTISIATKSVNSALIHFAINITQEGTPVPTMGLSDLKIDPKDFAILALKKAAQEWDEIQQAVRKVRCV